MRYFGYFVNIGDVITKISNKPNSLGFEVTNTCNANCLFCGYQYLKRPKAVLSMALFKKAIDEFDLFGGGGIGFTPIVGDPLLDPNFIEKIKYARSKKNISKMGFFTNGILINKIGARTIITSGIDAITISIGGFDRQAYSRICRVDQWDSVYDGILNLLKENELYNKRVKIYIALRSDVSIQKLLKSSAYKDIKRYKFYLEFNIYYDNWGGVIKQKDLRPTMHIRNPPRKREPCSFLYTGPMILSNGDMTLCGCRDLNGDSELVLGNIKDKSILEMWRGKRVENIKSGFYSLKYPRVCQDCSFYNDLSCFRKEKIKALLSRKYR